VDLEPTVRVYDRATDDGSTSPDRRIDALGVARESWSDAAAGDIESTARVGEDPTTRGDHRGSRSA